MAWLRALYQRRERLILITAVVFTAIVPYAVLGRFAHGRNAAFLGTWLDDQIPFEKAWQYFYVWFVIFTFLPATVIKDLRLLRHAARAYLAQYALCYSIFLLYPTRIVRYTDPTGDSFVDWGIRLNHWLDPPTNCFPSLHVATAVLASLIVVQVDKVIGAPAAFLAVAIAISTLTLKAHYVADVVAGAAIAVGIWWTMFRPHVRPGERPELHPRWLSATLPLGYVLAISCLYVGLYQRGWKVPPSPWEKPDEVYTWNPQARRFDPPAAAALVGQR